MASLPHGSLVIVMNLGLFAPVADVRHGVDELVRLGMEQMVPLRGYDEVTCWAPPSIATRKPIAATAFQ